MCLKVISYTSETVFRQKLRLKVSIDLRLILNAIGQAIENSHARIHIVPCQQRWLPGLSSEMCMFGVFRSIKFV